jgi:Tfp pilus assembly protein PilX
MNPRGKVPTTLRSRWAGRGRQRGASALFVTVVLVLVIMLLAITAAVLSNTQFKLAGNLQFENVAFNLAEGALAQAESWLATKPHGKSAGFTTFSTDTPHLYPIGSLASKYLDPLTMAWTDANSLKVDADGNQRYLIEKYGADNQPLGTGIETGGRPLVGCQKVDVFRISARGTTVRGTTKVVQTTYSVPSC